MACNTGTCAIRPLSSSGSSLIRMGTPLSIVLNPIDFEVWFTQPYVECVTSFLALLKSNDKLVMVTVGDVLTTDPTIASERTNLQNTVSDTFNVQNLVYPFGFYNGPRSATQATTRDVGGASNFNPLHITPSSGPITYNQVNAGYIYPFGYQSGFHTYAIPVYPNDPNTNILLRSWQNSYVGYFSQAVRFSEAPMFATTAEIDAITTNTDIMIIGYEQYKYGECGVKIDSVNTTYTFSLSGITGTFPFNHLLSFSRINPECGDPVMAKDKGSTILAFISGKWKIIGIVIGFNGATGYGSRIDYIADQLGIKAWDGTVKGFANFRPIGSDVTQWKTKSGLSDIKSFTESIEYRQIGITNTPSI